MKFYIVTPTYNSLTWLERCLRSVADQAETGVEVHHHVQDGGSTDGTAELLADWQQKHGTAPGYTFTYESTKDAGMYDALNKAWEKMPADADVTAHLNSDEQYLPHALCGVAAEFSRRSKADILLSSYFVLDADSRYICHRRPMKPHKWISRLVCEMMTCATFHRAETFRRHGLCFDTRWRSIGDLVLYRNIVNTSPRFAVVPTLYTTSFSVTGENLGWSQVTDREFVEYRKELSSTEWRLRKIAGILANIKRRSCDLWHAAPRQYEVYMPGATKRTLHRIKRPTSHWGCRTEGEK